MYVSASVCVSGGQHTQDTLLAGQVILRLQLEIALLKQFLGRSFASDPSSQKDPQVMQRNLCNGTVEMWKRRERGIAESPAKLSLGQGGFSGHRSVRRPSQKPQGNSGKCPSRPVSVPSRTVLAAYSCFWPIEWLLQPLSLSRDGSRVNLRGGCCCSRCQAAFCTAVQLGSRSSCQRAHPVIQLFAP